MWFGDKRVCAYVHLAIAVFASGMGASSHSQGIDAPFKTSEAFVRPKFDPGDEKFVRDFAKALGGAEFNADMQLPSCIWRTRTKSAGGYMEGYHDNDGWWAYARIPVPPAGSRFDNLPLQSNPTTYRSEFPTVAFIELGGRFESSRDIEDGKDLEWHAALILPAFDARRYPIGPPFRAASVSLGGQSFVTRGVDVVKGLPIRIPLKEIEKAFATWDGEGRLEVDVATLAPGDTAAPRVRLSAAFPHLKADSVRMLAEVVAMRRRDKAKDCNIFERECRDGECGL